MLVGHVVGDGDDLVLAHGERLKGGAGGVHDQRRAVERHARLQALHVGDAEHVTKVRIAGAGQQVDVEGGFVFLRPDLDRALNCRAVVLARHIESDPGPAQGAVGHPDRINERVRDRVVNAQAVQVAAGLQVQGIRDVELDLAVDDPHHVAAGGGLPAGGDVGRQQVLHEGCGAFVDRIERLGRATQIVRHHIQRQDRRSAVETEHRAVQQLLLSERIVVAVRLRRVRERNGVDLRLVDGGGGHDALRKKETDRAIAGQYESRQIPKTRLVTI